MNNKTKTFITVIPLQRRGQLSPVHYIPVGCDELDYEDTRFPIIPVIAHHAKGEKSIRVISVIIDGTNAEENSKHFDDAITAVKNKLKVNIESTVIKTPDEETIDTHLKLFADLIEVIRPNEELYACNTYGTKPTPMAVNLALNYADGCVPNTKVKRIVYGRYDHPVKDGEVVTGHVGYLYDITPLFFMDAIVNKLAEMKSPDPEKAIRIIMGLDLVEDEDDGEE